MTQKRYQINKQANKQTSKQANNTNMRHFAKFDKFD